MTVDYDIIVRGNNLSLREGSLGLANVTLVTCDSGPVLFDVGHYCNRPTLLAGLARLGMTTADVKAVFLSHLHFDHCNNIDLFPSAKVLVSRREWDYVDAPHAKDIFVPWLVREQLQKHDLELVDGEGRICDRVHYFPAPGHTPGSFALRLDTETVGCVAIAGDAMKYVKEALCGRSDMTFDTEAAAVATIARILGMADRVVPGHFPELIKRDGGYVWDEPAELPLLIR